MGQSIHPAQADRKTPLKGTSGNKGERAGVTIHTNQRKEATQLMENSEKKLEPTIKDQQEYRNYQQIKVMAETLMRDIERDLPTNLQALTTKHGIELKQKEIAPLTAKLVQTHGGKTVILLNLELSEREQRFAWAHALGHYFLQHGNMEDNPESYKRANPCGESVEANFFTLNILLPEAEIKRCIVNRIATDTEGLTRLFMVSETALMTQLYHLGYIKVLKEKTSKQ